MTISTKLVFGMLTLLFLLSIVGILVGITWPDNFNRMYESCSSSEAELVLHVKYDVQGLPSSREYSANYRRCPTWVRLKGRIRDQVDRIRGVIHLEDSCHNQQFEFGGLDGWVGYWSVWPYEDKDGVELTINYHAKDDHKEFELREEVKVPFPTGGSGHQGRISYFACWEHK